MQGFFASLRQTKLYMLDLSINNQLSAEEHLILSQQKSNADVVCCCKTY